MAQNPQTLDFKEIGYAPNWWKSKEPSDLYAKALQSILFTPTLTQIEFTGDGGTELFPDFDNIFSRSALAKKWWFLLPEDKKKPLLPEKYLMKWEQDFQDIYSKSILVKVDRSETRTQLALFGSRSNVLVASLLDKLKYPPDRGDTDDEDSCFSVCYYDDFFSQK